MDENTNQQPASGALTWERVVSGALQQASRHERALRACLAELGGYDVPMSDLADSTRRRATRHAERAIGLTRTAIRLNRDPMADAFLAALLERHERDALLVQQAGSLAEPSELTIAG